MRQKLGISQRQGKMEHSAKRASFQALGGYRESAVGRAPLPPLRSALFNADQLRQHGVVLARSHRFSQRKVRRNVLIADRLSENKEALQRIRAILAEAIEAKRKITPAGEWLLDNFYLIEEQIRLSRLFLPEGYSRRLPLLEGGPSAGLPRVYDIALEMISHGDGRVDPENLRSFVASYQSVSPLKLGELWAIPIMLRLALIENLRRVASRIGLDMAEQTRAGYWADRMIETAEKDPKSLILEIAEMVKSDPPMVSSFVAELSRRLQGQSPNLALPLTWIEQRLLESGATIRQFVDAEIQQEATDQVSMGNSIGSLRSLNAMDWHAFVEGLSAVDRVLEEDPAGAYAAMDFATRDRYRHAIEGIAERGGKTEPEVARNAIRLSRSCADKKGAGDRTAHVGYFLIDGGLGELERDGGVSPSLPRALGKFLQRFPLLAYGSAFFLGSAALAGVLLADAYENGYYGWRLGLLGALFFLCASLLAVKVLDWAASLGVSPKTMPRLDYSKGIPLESKTLVVVPTMLASADGIEDLFEALEIKFLANRGPNLAFALLTDFLDADGATLPGDSALLALAERKTYELNAKYPSPEGGVFFLFHRPRLWNPRERRWMGYERKRGKLEALNAYLRGGGRDSFSKIVGDAEGLSGVKYVITLDADTHLQRETAWQFAGAMAHPLNRPAYDPEKGRVTAGYGIIQPRVSSILMGSGRSRYAELCGGEPGIDPYTRTSSDLYQDLFGEGSYIGKGIYDVDAFKAALDGRFPENLVLSHDLLEGCHARSGLLSDVPLLEEYPTRYESDARRRRRWIRGDWQIVGWLLPGKRMSALSRWKILDNLRRSLVPPALAAFFLLGWILSPSTPLWTLSALGVFFIPGLLASAFETLKKRRDSSWPQHLGSAARSAGKRLAAAAFSLACLPHEASYCLSAILVTFWRMLISRRRLLDWETSADAGRKKARGLFGHYALMWPAPALAAAAGAFIAYLRPAAAWAAYPVLALWFFSPLVAWWLSRPRPQRKPRFSSGDLAFLGVLARKTWSFFETFVGPEDNWLPPDNFQERPVAAVAHRTSPTNIGLSLLANLAAYDFGYATAGGLVERSARVLKSMGRLERYQGHFLNWYDTRSLQPLAPKYVSSVDSGNLAAYLLTLKSGLAELPEKGILGQRFFSGLEDTLGALSLEFTGAPPEWLSDLIRDVGALSASPPATLGLTRLWLDHLERAFAAMPAELDVDPGSDAAWWAGKLAAQCRAQSAELALFAPWSERAAFLRAYPEFNSIPSLRGVMEMRDKLPPPGGGFPDELRLAISAAAARAGERVAAIEELVSALAGFSRMEYEFLYDRERRLLSIGYNVTDFRLDPGFYDLLASEARLCSFTAIAQGKLPQENWFALGRQLAATRAGPTLLSWGGSMFEYLMPLVVMPDFGSSLLGRACKAAVARQIEYGHQRGVPWGVSESGYSVIDASENYQYRAFGVPGLGLRRGLAEDLVVSPYSSALALMVAPESACANLRRLVADGFAGRYGLYEAIDFTASRLPPGKTAVVVGSFMAHHQGMSLLSLDNALLGQAMRRRFSAEPVLHSAEPLLQEKIPQATRISASLAEAPGYKDGAAAAESPIRVIDGPDTPTPEVQLLSNGRYHVMVTNSGGGYSRWKDLAVTRWREDGTLDDRGSFCYLRDVASGDFWSAAYQPTLAEPKYYEAIFSEGMVEFRRGDRGIDTHTSILVSPEDDIELRRVLITNRGRQRREIEVTSYSEIVMAPQAADEQHPAFGNLFMQTEIDPERRAILCHRRPRSDAEKTQWFFHEMAVYGAESDGVSYETDRSRFLGRWNSPAAPAAMAGGAALSGSQGSVLDPIAAIRCRVVLEPEESAVVDFISGVGETRPEALGLIEKYRDRLLADRVFDLAYTHSQVVLRQLNATEADAQLYGSLAGSVIFAQASLRADPRLIARNRRGQSGLWGYSISGDLPIVLLEIENIANVDLARQLIQAHAYWRIKGLAADLVIWNEDHAGYRQLLYDQIMGLLATGLERSAADRPGGIFVRSSDQIAMEDRILIQAAARVIVSDGRGSLAEQVGRRALGRKALPKALSVRSLSYYPPRAPEAIQPRTDLLFFNGYGGFTPDAREYIVTTAPGQVTPAPWVNVLANPRFGTVVSEGGQAYTWAENAHEFRLSPWHDDPVRDPGGEAFYIRDEERGHFWSPMPLPARGLTPYVTRHGFGYCVFEHAERGVRSQAWVYVAMDADLKFTVIKLTNESDRPRRLSVFGYVEWVLGDLRSKTAPHVVTEIDQASGALFAHNGYSMDFPGRVAFFDADGGERSFSGDRAEFIGRNGSLRDPAALSRSGLSNRVGASLDPCAAIQLSFDLGPGEDRELVFRLGVGREARDASDLATRFRGSYAAKTALEGVWSYWNRTLGAVCVDTPDPALNCIANGWLVYQTLACRMWGRSGYYQSGGAFGFRDQLQDSMALIYAEPQRTREQLLLCASRQFVEGDVQHWWHPPSGRGVRTHCSDDFLWLPLATARYVVATGDSGVLEEAAGFLEGRQVNPEEDSYYDLPNRSRDSASLYEHCKRAILRSEGLGERGLPLIGSGDWNDGMNLVGAQGKGESVWLGFFLHETLERFAAISDLKGDADFAARCRSKAVALRGGLESSGWDGGWYRRAFFDDGRMLGSASSPECKIDSISQSWAALSGAGDPGRVRLAMDAVYERLVSKEDGLVKLLAPPLDASDLNPGYIKGYLPGVRENGGQYTHAAVWTAMAFATLGEAERAWELTDMINPVNHARSPEGVETYKVEPYVMAADVYGSPPHAGRGGWTWYSGSAGWMYRLVMESILGLRLEIDKLRIEPCVPAGWDSYSIRYRYRETIYRIAVRRAPPGEAPRICLDGAVLEDAAIPLSDDRREHVVEALVIERKGERGL
jgi:cyclic beta-1,2-glucan synthetase